MVRDVLIALAASLWAGAPVVALLWFKWRLVVFGSLGVLSTAMFPLGMMVAGGAAWQPTGGSPITAMLVCWVVGALGILVAFRFVGGTWKERGLGVLAGVGVVAWTMTFYPIAEGFWSVVGTPP